MTICDNCGGHVSDGFVRVIGGDQGNLSAWPNCTANAGIGAVARERSAHERCLDDVGGATPRTVVADTGPRHRLA